MNKGIFIDLDGTLLNNQNQISYEDKNTIIKLTKHGFNIFLITGKSLANSLNFYQELQLTTPMITSCGQVISNPSNYYFKQHFIKMQTEDITKIINDIFFKTNIENFIIETTNKHFIKNNQPSNFINLIIKNKNDLIIYNKQKNHNVIGFYLEIKKITKYNLKLNIERLNKIYNNFEFVEWDTKQNLPIISIKPKGVNKSFAMKKIIRQMNLEYTIAIGNGDSDIKIIQEASIGIAMFNSSKKVKKNANYVSSTSNNDSGVSKALKEIDLIKKYF